MSYKTIHPLSTLPYNIPREILVEKYCRLLEYKENLINQIKILKMHYNVNIKGDKNIYIKGDNNIINIKKEDKNNDIDEITKTEEVQGLLGLEVVKKGDNNKLVIVNLSKSICYLSYKLNKNYQKEKVSKLLINEKEKVPKILLNEEVYQKEKVPNLLICEKEKVPKILLNEEVNILKSSKKSINNLNYYITSGVITKIKQLKEINTSNRKIVDILNDEGFLSSN
jgi:hypothetical protein